MKKTKLLVVLLLAVISFSCSKDDDSSAPPETPPEELTLEEKLIEGSPWDIDYIEVINIIDAGASLLTKTEIENDQNDTFINHQIVFNADGTGIDIIPSLGNANFEWEVIDGDKIQITYIGENPSIYIFEKTVVSNSQLVYEYEALTYDDSTDSEVRFIVKFTYN